MLKIEKTVLPSPEQWDAIIRGMRNPLNSWHLSDSYTCAGNGDTDQDCPKCHLFEDEHDGCTTFCHNHEDVPVFLLGEADHQLMMKLAKGGAVHAKYRRMITVMCDITAPFYWWKEFDTYKVGTVANSCSTMHKIHAKEFTLDDFSCEHLSGGEYGNIELMKCIIECLNVAREQFLETKDKDAWWQMIQILPTSYNQKRTVLLNYEVLVNIYHSRKNHKLDEWHTFCDWIQTLPHSEIIVGE